MNYLCCEAGESAQPDTLRVPLWFVLHLSLHCSNFRRDQNLEDLGKFMANVTILCTVIMDGTVECMFVAEFLLIPL